MLARWRSHAERNVTTTGSLSIDCICCAKRLMTSIADSRKDDYEQSFSSFKAVVTHTNKTVQFPRSYLGGYMLYICPGFPRSAFRILHYSFLPSHFRFVILSSRAIYSIHRYTQRSMSRNCKKQISILVHFLLLCDGK